MTILPSHPSTLAEIESLIVERLFAHHLLEIGKIKQEDYDYLDREQEDSLIYEANIIKEEQNVIRQLPMPITFESLNSLVEKLKQKEKTTRLISRIKKMNKSTYKRSRYYFRYFVGRIVAYEWFDRFQASTSEQQKEMLEKFEQYLDKNVNYGLNSACEFLLGQNFEKAVLSFIEKRKKSSVNTNPILERIEEEKRRILTDDEDEDEFENRAAKK